jgi:asparagine synthase (glutamine-hydrolysing)
MPPARAKAELLQMLEALPREDFYQTGTWIDESLGVYVGWTVQKNSFSDGMPLRNERGDVCLVFSGDEYPDPETLRRLKQQGHSFDPEGSSYLVHFYEEDPNFPANLNGMFHGLLVDKTRGTATLFNDRAGMHRVCYHESNEAFYFGAEAKAILAARPELRTADAKSLGEFVAFSCILQNRTIFKDVQVLPAGSAWVFRNGSLDRKGLYFRASEWENQDPVDSEEYYVQLRDALSKNLPRYFGGHERIGVTLTGGLDTRVIVALHQSAAGSTPCYTFGSQYHDCQDVKLGRKVAELTQQSHQVIEIGDQFLSRFPHYAERTVYLTEGGVDVYRASDLYFSEKARQIAPVKIVGSYGSEIVRHAVMFKPTEPLQGLFRPEFLSDVHSAGDTYAEVRREHPVTFAAFLQSPWYHHGVLALEQSQLTVRSPFMDNDFVRTVFRAPKSSDMTADVRLRLIRDGNSILSQLRSDRGVGGNGGQLSAAALRGFLEFTFKAEYAYDYGMPQWVAQIDHMFAPLHLERLFLGRHKFSHYRVWYRDALSSYVREMLLDPRTLSRPFFERRALEAMVKGHLKGNRNYTTSIHKALTLELLHRLFLDPR